MPSARPTIRLWLVLFWVLLCGVSLAAGLAALEESNYPWDRANTITAVTAIAGMATLWCVGVTVCGVWRMRRIGWTPRIVYWTAALLGGFVAGGFVVAALLAAVMARGDGSVGEMIKTIMSDEGRVIFAVAGAIGGAIGLVFGLLWRIPLKLARRAKGGD